MKCPLKTNLRTGLDLYLVFLGEVPSISSGGVWKDIFPTVAACMHRNHILNVWSVEYTNDMLNFH